MACSTVIECGLGPHGDQVGAHALDLLRPALPRARTKRHHRDERCNPMTIPSVVSTVRGG
jgi:hypothetical protein